MCHTPAKSFVKFVGTRMEFCHWATTTFLSARIAIYSITAVEQNTSVVVQYYATKLSRTGARYGPL